MSLLPILVYAWPWTCFDELCSLCLHFFSLWPSSSTIKFWRCMQDVMEDPWVAPDGYTYEREAIERWLSNHDTSPMSNLPLPNKNIIPNRALSSAISEWKSRNHWDFRFHKVRIILHVRLFKYSDIEVSQKGPAEDPIRSLSCHHSCSFIHYGCFPFHLRVCSGDFLHLFVLRFPHWHGVD